MGALNFIFPLGNSTSCELGQYFCQNHADYFIFTVLLLKLEYLRSWRGHFGENANIIKMEAMLQKYSQKLRRVRKRKSEIRIRCAWLKKWSLLPPFWFLRALMSTKSLPSI